MSVLKKAKTMLYGIIDFPLWFEWRRFFGAQALQALKLHVMGVGVKYRLIDGWQSVQSSLFSSPSKYPALTLKVSARFLRYVALGSFWPFSQKSIAFWVTPTLCASAFCERKCSSLNSLIRRLRISIWNILVETYLKSLDKVEFYYYYKSILIFSYIEYNRQNHE